MTDAVKKCLDCGEPLVGRRDKKFCSDLCRNNYNNRLNRDTTNLVRNINNILRRNRRMLASLVADGKTKTITKQKLADKGFNFNYFTHNLITKKGTYFFVYEYGYIYLEDDFLMLVKSDN